VQHQKMVHLLV